MVFLRPLSVFQRRGVALVAAGVSVGALVAARRDRWLPVHAAVIPIGGAGGNGGPLGGERAGGWFPSAAPVDDGLCGAAYSQDAAVLRVRLSEAEGDAVNAPGQAGVTPLMVAAYRGDLDVVEALLEHGARPDIASAPAVQGGAWEVYFPRCPLRRELQTAVEFALLGGHPQLLRRLIECSPSDPTSLPQPKAKPKPRPRMFGMPPGMGPDDAEDAPSSVPLASLIPRATSNPLLQQKLRTAIDDGMAAREQRQREYRAQFPLEARLGEQLVGQKHAIHVVAAAIRRKENGWVDSDSPLVLMFMGSSGIGKTKTAKLVAQYLFGEDGKDKRFIRIDMSEFQSKHEVSKFIGAPPGYVGYEQGGQLVSKLREHPDAVVLLDEVEKAHPDVLTVMLQAFDEGRMTDGQGKTVDCREAVFILTSNLAQHEIADEAVKLRDFAKVTGNHPAPAASAATADLLTKGFKQHVVHPILRRHFGRDEFIGRINEIVFFLPFTESEQHELAHQELGVWAARAQKKHSIDLTWTPAVAALASQEYNLRYGARSIKYEIDRMCVAPIARAQEMGVVERGCRILVDVDWNALHTTAAPQSAPPAPPTPILPVSLGGSERDHVPETPEAAPSLAASLPGPKATPPPDAKVFREGHVVLYVSPPAPSGRGLLSRIGLR